jgi:hypothetical protein
MELQQIRIVYGTKELQDKVYEDEKKKTKEMKLSDYKITTMSNLYVVGRLPGGGKLTLSIKPYEGENFIIEVDE